MTPQEHKEQINDAMRRCIKTAGTAAYAGALGCFNQKLEDLLTHYQACIAHNNMLLARLRLQEQQMDAIGAGGVSGQSITGGKT